MGNCLTEISAVWAYNPREKRPGGLGSLGRRRYMAVLKKGRDQYIAREAKALVPSAPAEAARRQVADGHALSAGRA
jgi:uncharacterized protein (DUF2252 family)